MIISPHDSDSLSRSAGDVSYRSTFLLLRRSLRFLPGEEHGIFIVDKLSSSFKVDVERRPPLYASRHSCLLFVCRRSAGCENLASKPDPELTRHGGTRDALRTSSISQAFEVLHSKSSCVELLLPLLLESYCGKGRRRHLRVRYLQFGESAPDCSITHSSLIILPKYVICNVTRFDNRTIQRITLMDNRYRTSNSSHVLRPCDGNKNRLLSVTCR